MISTRSQLHSIVCGKPSSIRGQVIYSFMLHHSSNKIPKPMNPPPLLSKLLHIGLNHESPTPNLSTPLSSTRHPPRLTNVPVAFHELHEDPNAGVYPLNRR